MKNYNKKPNINSTSDLNPEDIIDDFNKLNYLLSGLDSLNPDADEAELESIKETTSQIKNEFEDKYKKHLNTEDYNKQKEEILKFGEEAEKEIKEFKSNLDSLK
tara:strand:+ start:81 stop:392 length:312 start_codon:yes stop_codon:yes gene_type:complete